MVSHNFFFHNFFSGLTPLDVAEKADHEECMVVLRAAADKIEAQRVETLTILQDACSQVSDFTKFLEKSPRVFTVWKFQDFSTTQILCEIDFGGIL